MSPLAFIGPVVGIVGQILTGGGFKGAVVDLARALADKRISEAEFEAEMEKAWASANAQIMHALSESSADIFAEAQETIRQSFKSKHWLTANAWSFVVWSQTLVLLWYQIGIPFYVQMFGGEFARTGDDLLKWAYALVGGALGIGVLNEAKQGFSGLLGRRK